MKRTLLQAALSAALCTLSAAQAAVAEKTSTLADQQSVAVTIYNETLALIKEVRRIDLAGGPNRLALREVSAQMRPETALLRSLSHPGALRLVEQNFDFDLLTPAKLLEKYVGREVRIVRTHPQTGAESVETATVLAANGGIVLKIGDRIETGLPGRIVYDGRALIASGGELSARGRRFSFHDVELTTAIDDIDGNRREQARRGSHRPRHDADAQVNESPFVWPKRAPLSHRVRHRDVSRRISVARHRANRRS